MQFVGDAPCITTQAVRMRLQAAGGSDNEESAAQARRSVADRSRISL